MGTDLQPRGLRQPEESRAKSRTAAQIGLVNFWGARLGLARELGADRCRHARFGDKYDPAFCAEAKLKRNFFQFVILGRC